MYLKAIAVFFLIVSFDNSGLIPKLLKAPAFTDATFLRWGPPQRTQYGFDPCMRCMVVPPGIRPSTVKQTFTVISEALHDFKVIGGILLKVLLSLKSRNSCHRQPNKFEFGCCSENIEGHKFCFECRQEIIGYSTRIIYNDQPIFSRLTQGDMPYLCVGFIKSLSLLSFCVKVYGVQRTGRRFHACFYFTIRVLKETIVSVNFECIEISLDGEIQFLPPKRQPQLGALDIKVSKLNPFYNSSIDVVQEAKKVVDYGKKFLNIFSGNRK